MAQNFKATHYWTQLRLALTAGSWSSKYPAKAINGTALSWSELLRKFNKHCKGFGDVAEIANHTQGLGVWLGGVGGQDDEGDTSLGARASRSGSDGGRQYQLDLGDECILREERRQEASASFDSLKRLNATNCDSLNFLLAYYAYALGSPTDCLAYLAQVPDIVQLQNHISSAASTRTNTLSVAVPTSLSPSLVSLTAAGTAVSETNVAESLKDGRAWAMTEAFRSICLQGMCQERLSPQNPFLALQAYASALPLFRLFAHELAVIVNPPNAPASSIASALSIMTSSGSFSTHTSSATLQSTSLYLLAANLKQRSSKIDYPTTFEKFRETWRWVERILRRAILILARTWDVASGTLPLLGDEPLVASPTNIQTSTSQHSTLSTTSSNLSEPELSSTRASSIIISVEPYNLWTWLEYYTMFSAFWPPTFRPSHRSAIYIVYMRALILKYSSTTSRPTQATRTSSDGSRSATPTPGHPQPEELTPRPPPALYTPPEGTQSNASSHQPARSHTQWHLQLHQDRQPHSIAPKAVIQEYKAILDVTTKFPKAGERNWKVEEFVDLCVALWEALDNSSRSNGRTSGQEQANTNEGLSAAFVIDVFWWATRLTFKSHRVLRHLIRLLYVSGDLALAKRTLKLYVQLVSKAWETRDSENSQWGGTDKDGGEDTGHKKGDEEGMESNHRWIETLVFGVKMLCRSAALAGSSCSSIIFPVLSTSGSGGGLNPASAGVDGVSSGRNNSTAGLALRLVGSQNAGGGGIEARADVRDAGDFIQKAKKSLEDMRKSSGEDDAEYKRLRSGVQLADGVYHTVLALIEHDPASRSTQLETAHNLFRASVTTHPTTSGFYHLALSYASPGPQRDIEAGIEFAGKAIETEPKEPRYWHLLGLLLAKMERWKDAEEILERGASLGDAEADAEQGKQEHVQDDEGDEDTESISEQSFTEENTVRPYPMVSANGRARRRVYNFVIPEGTKDIPKASQLLRPPLDLPQSKKDVFEFALQLRMSQIALMEVIQGAEGATEKALETFAWVAAKKGAAAGSGASSHLSDGTSRPSLEGASMRTRGTGSIIVPNGNKSVTNLPTSEPDTPPALDTELVDAHGGLTIITDSAPNDISPTPSTAHNATASEADGSTLLPPPITISPATPEASTFIANGDDSFRDRGRKSGTGRRSQSVDREKETKGKKVQQMLKNRVREERVRITAISRKIGHGVAKSGLKKAMSTPDFHAVLRPMSYQASSIHSRKRLSSLIHHDRTPNQSPPPAPLLPTMPPLEKTLRANSNMARGNRLLSDLWLMTAATFRRQGKIEQARGSIQEAEALDESNPSVWVQLGLYYIALGHHKHALDAFQKALFMNPDDVSANVHLARMYLTPPSVPTESNTAMSPPSSPTQPGLAPSFSCLWPPTSSQTTIQQDNVDLAAGLLAYLTRGTGWDIPEAWYYLSKAYGLQGRGEKEREAITHALTLSEHRGIRDLNVALGWC